MRATFDRLFVEHPASVQESYFQHMCTASGFGVKLLSASLMCFVHALLPGCFETKASERINKLYESMVLHRVKSTSDRPEPISGIDP